MSLLEQTRARVPRFAQAVSQQRARLFVVAPAGRAPRLPFAALVLTVLGLGLVGLLVLNTTLQHQAFFARALEKRADDLAVSKQTLTIEVDELRAPDRVAREAQELGMLPNHSPAFLFLADGTIRGGATPADPATRLRLDPLPPPAPKAERTDEPERAEPAGPSRADRNDQ